MKFRSSTISVPVYPRARNGRMVLISGLANLSSEYWTSSEVTGSPLLNRALSRRVKLQVRPSSLTSHDSARAGDDRRASLGVRVHQRVEDQLVGVDLAVIGQLERVERVGLELAGEDESAAALRTGHGRFGCLRCRRGSCGGRGRLSRSRGLVFVGAARRRHQPDRQQASSDTVNGSQVSSSLPRLMEPGPAAGSDVAQAAESAVNPRSAAGLPSPG